NNSLSLKESKLSRDNAQKKLEDYTITAPISGTVIEKNVKAGDKLDNQNVSTVMAVIYDMSALECELSVDELDIKNVTLGQKVTITSDALENKVYNGEVTNISINGTTENGVTTYPVTINITDFDEALLPGMNIDATIITSQAENVLSVPVSAVQRGNTVYVKGEKTDEADRAPEGYKSVTVQTGIYNDTFIEITSGISEGDFVWVPPVDTSSDFADLMRGMGGGMPGGGMGGGGMGGGGMGGPPSGGGAGGNRGGAPGGGMR
ncbi:MAG: efflux RND transporter periplasmic adaptor subunit, partial [Clostridia bacterium]|nr:efflux RND transporter periplasmic adaptor subunit [Clostridia bacterium]